MKNLKKILLVLFLAISLFSFARGNSQETIRFGSKMVGFITVPTNWHEFVDSNPATPSTAKQVSIDNTNIITLGIVNNQSVTPEEMAISKVAKYLNSGIPEENIEMNDVTLNGYNGQRVIVAFDDGTVLEMYFIKANGKLYSLTQEGYPKYQAELAEVLSTWHPNR